VKVLGSKGRPERGCALTIGAFDGVHVGHRKLIAAVIERARQLDVASAVVTFDCHPASVVRPDSAPKLLTDLDQKLELLEQTGVDYTLVVPFNEERASEEAEDFVNDVFVSRLGARSVFIGHDFHFGRGRRGNAELLEKMGVEHGFEVRTVDALTKGDDVVSSTLIRSRLLEGNLDSDVDRPGVFDLLGRDHEVRGLVTMGDGRGRELGYPTANVHVDQNILMPTFGVYAGEYVMPDRSVLPAMISWGTRPTFYEDGAQLLEAHVFDFEGDLYGQHASVRFRSKLRGQQRFDSAEALIEQMDRDAEQARSLMCRST
jgi:riboflavin kinase / FMN adenylyltransferase